MHWKHSRYQIVYQILGNCHTVDEAYRVLCELEEDRDFSIKISFVESFRAQAKVVSNKSILNTSQHNALNNSMIFETEGNMLQAQAFIDEVKARTPMAQSCLDEARREISFIQTLKSKIDPFRRYRNYDLHEANQLCQVEEYYFDLLWKAYNHICAMNGIPADHWMLIKMHPMHEQLTERVGWLINILKDNPNKFYAMTKMDVFSKDFQENILNVSNLSIESGGKVSYDHTLELPTKTNKDHEITTVRGNKHNNDCCGH